MKSPRDLFFWVVRPIKHVPIVIVRLSVGSIFLSEGIQKFLFADSVGAGRFAKIGLPSPEFLAHLVGITEIACGIMVLAGFLMRLACVPLLVIILTAIASTKVPIFLEHGFWKMAHEARTDYAMLLSLIFLLIVGAGRSSLDYILAKKVG
jgi:putative oxidoreductase